MSHEFDTKLKQALEIYLQKKLSSLPNSKDLEYTCNFSHKFEENIKKLSRETDNRIPE